MKKRFLIGSFLLLGAVCVLSAAVLAEREQRALSEKLIRLHVIAASDSEADQSMKLLVRDAVLAEIGEQDWTSREEAAAWLTDRLPALEAAAEETLRASGSAQTAAVTLSREHYPTRNYPGFSLPAGEYLSLRVVIGEGEGKNWWCVVYPSLCSAAQSELPAKAASAGFSDREIRLITADTDGVKLKFKLLEWLSGKKS